MGGSELQKGFKGKLFPIAFLFCMQVWCAQNSLNAQTVVVLSPNTEHATFASAIQGLEEGLEGECDVINFPITKRTPVRSLKTFLDEAKPHLIVLMDNKAVSLYKKFQRTYSEDYNFPPSVILMTLYADKLVDTIDNAMTVEYQIPAVMSLVYFRALLKNPMRKAGMIYRHETAYFFEKQKQGCTREGIELVGVEVVGKNNRVSPKNVREALKKLILKEEIDVLLIMDDNSLLTRKLLQKAWIPILNKYKLPTIVGNEHFVSEQDLIGNFAVIPDSFALGDQTAQIILDIKDRDWSLEEDTIHEPISVRKLLNTTKLPEYLLNRASLDEVDSVIKK